MKNDFCRSTVRAEPVPTTKNATGLLGIGTHGIAPFKLSGVFLFIAINHELEKYFTGGIYLMIVNAKEFCKRTGFPLTMIRRLCRTGVIRHWQCGRMYLFDEDKAMKTLEMLQEQPPVYSSVLSCSKFGRNKTLPKGGKIRSYSEELRQLLQERRKQEREKRENKNGK